METNSGSDGAGDVTLNRLFVYGTLRPRANGFGLVEASVVDHRPAVLSGYTLVGEGHRYPWCVQAPGFEVAGDLLWLREVEQTLIRLDEYEGVHEPNPEYVRSVADVMTGSDLVPAWVYVGSVGVPGGVRPIEGADWLR